ncbi:porin [Photobacterium leiognathi]|uniref:porin n=1 Tax=Photobacterium leiognathi TaxID=553611 RepID=UPI00298217ED|nr:porin [Photobacterium leiognathi]
MEKMFKRTLLGAAVATAAMSSISANAYEIGKNNDFNVEVYGVAAISVVNYDVKDDDKSQGPVVENESRIGFRAGKEMLPGLTVGMQIESGYVDNTDWPHGGVSGGVLGFRDTFISLSGDWGKVRVGRVLTPMYELIDWPYANPGLGDSWDWGGDVGYYYDRQSNTIRYDSTQLGPVNFSLAVGRDDNNNGGGSATHDSYFYGGKISVKAADFLTLHAGTETSNNFNGKEGVDTFGYLAGFEASLPAGFGLAAAYKWGESDDNGVKHEQGSYSVIGQYWNGPLGFKVGYTANLDSKYDGVKRSDADDILSGQVMYVVNGFVPYLRVANRDKVTWNAKDSVYDQKEQVVVRVGLEYGF